MAANFRALLRLRGLPHRLKVALVRRLKATRSWRRFVAALTQLAAPRVRQTTALVSAPFAYGKPEAVGLRSRELDAIADGIESWVLSGEVVGASFLVIKNQTVVLHEAIGWRDREAQIPLGLDAVFAIRSMTKPVVGTVVLMLVEEGRLALDDAVASVLPSFDHDRSRAITVRQLLTHTAGLSHPGYPEPLEGYRSLRQAVDAVGEAGPSHPPGARFVYSDASTAVLAAVAAAVTSSRIEDLIHERVLEPLGMRQTSCELPLGHPLRPRVGPAYRQSANGFRKYWTNTQPPLLPFFRASGGLYSTPLDYARFISVWMHGGRYGEQQLFSRQTARAALEIVPASAMSGSGLVGSVGYGMQWQIFAPPRGERLPHFGHAGSDGTMALAMPERDLAVLYFTQSRGTSTAERLAALVAEAWS